MIESAFAEKDLNDISKIIKDKIFVPLNEKTTTLFICGAERNDREKARYHISTIFNEHKKYDLLYPEDLFDDLLVGQGQFSLLEMENILAQSVDAIILAPESPGSFAELGAFSNNKNLANKMIVVGNIKFKSDKSFINYGPFRLIRNSDSGKVIYANYEGFKSEIIKDKLFKNLSAHISKIKNLNPVKKDVANILESEFFILPCIYLIDKVPIKALIDLMEIATNQNRKLCEIATRAGLTSLVQKKLINKESDGYSITLSGIKFAQSKYNSSYLDNARLEILNAHNRRNASVNYDRL